MKPTKWKLLPPTPDGKQEVVFRTYPDGRGESVFIINPEYVAWLAKGNAPDPADEPLPPEEQ